MLTFSILLSSLLLVSFSLATPVSDPVPVDTATSLSHLDTSGLFCRIPIIKTFCPRQSSNASPTVSTPLGPATGVSDSSGAFRFTVKYASVNRWEHSSVATSWELPNGSNDPSAPPLPCAQPGIDDSSMSEDCLSVILYVPTTLNVGSNVPTMLWIHGGSFIVGSATGPGLDGSKLAIAMNSIVAVVQYRLGAFGFMGPNQATNLGVEDIVNSLQFLQKILPSFGGDPSKVTIAGQSSGASMIRALLAVPSASSLFHSAIMQSDPMDFGFLSTAIQKELQAAFDDIVSCNNADISCYDALSVDAIIDAEGTVFGNALSIDPAAGDGFPIRMVNDGSLITSPLDSTAPFPRVSKSLLISTVKNEAALDIYGSFTDSVPVNQFSSIVNATFGAPRTNQIITSPFYAIPSSEQDARVELEVLGTDYLWKCSGWTFARNWVGNGGVVHAGTYMLGATYPGNEQVPICTDSGVVCHQDDIEIVFGTVSQPTAAQAALTTEMQARYGAFLQTGNPNPTSGSFAQWNSATTTDVNAIQLGAAGLVPIGACTPTFWGDQPQYDYQVFVI